MFFVDEVISEVLDTCTDIPGTDATAKSDGVVTIAVDIEDIGVSQCKIELYFTE